MDSSPPTRADRLGILGGGQLARMMAEAAIRQGVQPVVLTGSPSDPAAVRVVDRITGSIDDDEALAALLARCDVVTIENEFVDVERLRAVAARFPDVRFLPALDAVAAVQDKLAQKQLFDRVGARSADFETVRGATLDEDLDRVYARFPDGFVLKWSRFGYDGRGNLAVRPESPPPREEIARFCARGEERGATLYAERRVDFVCELAMVAARGACGTTRFFPLVVSRQEKGVCREIVGPATGYGVERGLARRAEEILAAIGDALAWCGAFAVEFFLDGAGELFVNEMAPRVHNTGHYTLFDGEPSQFDLHVQAVTGRALSTPGIHGTVLMRNLLGPPTMAPGARCSRPVEPPPAGTRLYWYDKATVFPGRKMGHVTARTDSVEQATAVLEAMRSYEDRIWRAAADGGN